MFKLLVNGIRGFQEVIQVDRNGGYFDDSQVVWDERKHGVMPEFEGQGQTRVVVDGSPRLEVDNDLKASQDVAKASWDNKVALERIKETLAAKAVVGRDVVMRVAAMNVQKGLSEAERSSFASTFSQAKALLEQGLLSEAKSVIQGLDLPTGYDESDRSAIIAAIDSGIAIS